MNYLLKSKPKYENRAKIIAIVVMFVMLSGVNYLFFNFVKISSHSVVRPIWSASNYISRPFSGIVNFFSFKSNLVKQNGALSDEVELLKLKQLDYNILLQENQELKEQLNRAGSGSKISSKVLSKPPRSPYDTLVVDSGSSVGVSAGSRVYLADGVIIGFVTNVTPNTSLVQLFSTGDNKQEVILSRTGTSFTLTGKGGANFSLDVPKDTDILWGDVFLYPSSSGSVVGSVYYIDQNSQSSFKTIHVRIPGNVFSAQWVFIEKNN
ncbi:MAG: rod shape-determining protein MreC [Parcubacteria group bacterium]